MKKYLALLRSNLSASLSYRGVLLTWIMVELVALTSAVFLWSAIFRTHSQVGSYDFSKVVTYFILVPLVGGFTSIYVSDHLPRKIKDGQVSVELMKPYSLALATLIHQFSFKVTQLTLKLPIYFLVVLFFALIFDIKFHLLNMGLALGVCVFSYLLHFSMDLALSYSAFWFDDTWSLSLLKTVCLMVLGGIAFPLDLAPPILKSAFLILPFRFLYFFPVKVAQGGMPLTYFFSEFLQLLSWFIFFIFLGKILWKFGLKKYGAYGN